MLNYLIEVTQNLTVSVVPNIFWVPNPSSDAMLHLMFRHIAVSSRCPTALVFILPTWKCVLVVACNEQQMRRCTGIPRYALPRQFWSFYVEKHTYLLPLQLHSWFSYACCFIHSYFEKEKTCFLPRITRETCTVYFIPLLIVAMRKNWNNYKMILEFSAS